MNNCKYYKQKKQYSTDGGVTWQDVVPAVYRKGELYENESSDCHIFDGKFKATYTGGSTYELACNSSTTLSSEETQPFPSEYDETAMTEAIIGYCVTTIGDRAFQFCSGLTSVTIPNSVTSIGEIAFSFCGGLTSIGITGSGASIEIPNSVTYIGPDAFSFCSGLTNVVINSNITSIGEAAFNKCSGLTSVTIPNSVTSISKLAFDGCSSLTSINIPSGVTSIGIQAFFRCLSLRNIDIPSGVTSIGNLAFNECRSLTSITINAVTPPTLGEQVFHFTNNCPIYVPLASVNAYKNASGWSNYANRITSIP